MERLKNHSEFVDVVKQRNKVTSADVVAHFRVRTQDDGSPAIRRADAASLHSLHADGSSAEDSLGEDSGAGSSFASSASGSFAEGSSAVDSSAVGSSADASGTEPCSRQEPSTRELQSRLGLAVSKAVGKAVTRNRVKRRFRQLARKHEHRLSQPCDIVLRAKPSASQASYASLDSQIGTLFDAIDRKAARRLEKPAHRSEKTKP